MCSRQKSTKEACVRQSLGRPRVECGRTPWCILHTVRACTVAVFLLNSVKSVLLDVMPAIVSTAEQSGKHDSALETTACRGRYHSG